MYNPYKGLDNETREDLKKFYYLMSNQNKEYRTKLKELLNT